MTEFHVWLMVFYGSCQIEAQAFKQKIIYNEGLADKDWEHMAAYMIYGEPTYSIENSWTKDGFTNSIEGYYTKSNRVHSVGWELAGDESHFSGMLIDYKSVKRCGAILLTAAVVMTPCACVREFWFHSNKLTDSVPDYMKEYDLGLHINVVINTNTFDSGRLGEGIKSYPNITRFLENGTFKCLKLWNDKKDPVSEYNFYMQIATPALLVFEPGADPNNAVPWPPTPLTYHTETTYAGLYREKCRLKDRQEGLCEPDGTVAYSYYFLKTSNTSTLIATTPSFYFSPLEGAEKLRDNYNNPVKLENRLIELDVALCDQSYCLDTHGFIPLDVNLHALKKLHLLQCWCDKVDIDTARVFEEAEDEGPLYKNTIFRGLVGAPIVHRGLLAGYLMHPIEKNVNIRNSPGFRATLGRAFDPELIDYLDRTRNQLLGTPIVDDRVRPDAIFHRYNFFFPEVGIRPEEVDLDELRKIGNPNAQAVVPFSGALRKHSCFHKYFTTAALQGIILLQLSCWN